MIGKTMADNITVRLVGEKLFSGFEICFDVSNIIISHYEYIVKIYKNGRYICDFPKMKPCVDE